jgi:hypothetical protein
MNRSDFKSIKEGDRIRNVRTRSKGSDMSSNLFTVTNNDVINDILSLTSTMGETHTISYGHKGDMREDGSTIKGCYHSLDFHYIDKYELLNEVSM